MAENFRRRKSRWEITETHFPNKVRKDNALPAKAVLSHDKESKSSWSTFKYNPSQISKWSEVEGSNAQINGDDFDARQFATWYKRPPSPKSSDIEADHKEGSNNSSWKPVSGSQSTRGDDNVSRETAGWGATVDETDPGARKQHKEGLKNSSWEPVSGIQSTRVDDNISRDTACWGTALDETGPDAWKQCKESFKNSSWEPASGSQSARADDNVSRGAAGWVTALDQTGPDAWKQHNHSVSPNSGWNRPYRSRSRSPFKALRHDSESRNTRGRKGGTSAAPCGDFVAGWHRRGGQCRYLHEDGSPRHYGRHHDNDATEIRKSRSGRGRYAMRDNKEDIRDSLDQSNYSRNRFSRRHESDGSGEPGHVYKTSRSAGLCHDFARGRCHRGSMCRYLQHDASSGSGPFRKDNPWERTFHRRDADLSSFRQNLEPHRVTDVPCKYFAKGHCRRGEDCKFSHQVLTQAHTKERRDDDRWNTGLESDKSPVWNGSKWGDKTAPSWNGPKWGDETAPSWNSPKWGDESATLWDGPKWGDQAATSWKGPKRDDVARMHSPNSSRWMSDSNDAGDADPCSMGIEDYTIKSQHPPSTEPEKNNHQSLLKEGIEIALPSQGQNMTKEVTGKDQNIPSVTAETAIEGTCIQGHPSIMEEVLCGGEESENVNANSEKSQADMKFSADNLQTAVSGQNQCFGESQQSLHLAPQPPDAQYFTQNEHNQQVLPHLPSNTNLTGQNLQCLLPHNGQSQNLAEQSQQYLSLSPHIPPSLQVDASNGQNQNSHIVPPSAQPNQISVSQQLFPPTSDGMKSVTPDTDNLPPVFKSISVEIKDPAMETLQDNLNNSFSLPVTDGHNEGNLNNSADLAEKLHGSKQECKQELKRVEPDGDDSKKVSEMELGQSMKEEQIDQSKGANTCAHTNGEGKRSRDYRDVRMFKFALVEYVKDILKPTWKEGRLTKEAHKIIVKKVAEKVTSTLQDPAIPWTQERIDMFFSNSEVKLNKLVQAYVQKYGKS